MNRKLTGRRMQMLLFPALMMLVVSGWLVLDGLRSKAKQAARYALPTDTSSPSLLEFLRRMDGSANAPGSLLESSNMGPICKAVAEAYTVLARNRDRLSEVQQREADYYYLAYSALAMTHGITPCTDASVDPLLAGSRSFLFRADSFGAREWEIMNRTLALLEATDRIAAEVRFVNELRDHIRNSPGLASGTATNALSSLERISGRLSMLGQVAELTSRTIDQQPFDIGSLRGKAVLIEFWGTRCIPCMRDIPALKRIYQSNRERFEIVGICLTSEPARIENFTAEHDLPWLQLCDDRSIGWECNQRLAEQFGVLGVPASLLIDPNGVVVKLGVRPLCANKALDLEECLASLFSKQQDRQTE